MNYKNKQLKRNSFLEQRICLACGSLYFTSNNWERYCSNKCKPELYWTKEKIRKCEFCGYDNVLALEDHHVKGSDPYYDNYRIVLCANHHVLYHKIKGKQSWQLFKETRDSVIETLKQANIIKD
jgi:hypothetical protein